VKKFFKDFRNFAIQGDLLQIATAFVIGLYFKQVVDSFTNGIMLALISALFGKSNFSDIGFTLNNSRFHVGDFLNAIINFVLVAFIVFVMIRVWERMRDQLKLQPDPELTADQQLLTEIRDLLRAQQEPSDA
jgi:large conductance mechanosensitive channel